MTHMTTVFAAAIAVTTMAGTASAMPVWPDPVLIPGTTCLTSSLTLGGNEADACQGIYSGNDSNQNLDGFFGYDWTFAAKQNTPGEYEGEEGFGLFASGGTSGRWGVESWEGFSTVMVVLKAGPTFSAFLFENVGDALTGLFDTQSNLTGGNRPKLGPGLSHISLYVTDEPAPIPVPAAGLLLAGALGGLAVAKRRKA